MKYPDMTLSPVHEIPASNCMIWFLNASMMVSYKPSSLHDQYSTVFPSALGVSSPYNSCDCEIP